MDLEIVIQSEVSQKSKNKYSILVHICGIKKKKKIRYRGTYLQSRNRDTDAENRRVDIVREGKGGKNLEIKIDIYTLLLLLSCFSHIGLCATP